MDDAQALLDELDRRWLWLNGNRPFVRPLLRAELDHIEPPPPDGCAALALVEMDPHGSVIHRTLCAVIEADLRELGMPSARTLRALMDRDRARTLN